MPTPVYALDIETDTTVDGLDPSVAAIIAVAVHDGTRAFVIDGDEKTILEDLDTVLTQLPEGVIATWNGASFDWPFLAERAQACGVEWGLRVVGSWPAGKYGPLKGHAHAYTVAWDTPTGFHTSLDICEAYRPWANTAEVAHSLKPVARAAGCEVVEVDRERLHELSREEVAAYAASDADITRTLALKLLGAA